MPITQWILQLVRLACIEFENIISIECDDYEFSRALTFLDKGPDLSFQKNLRSDQDSEKWIAIADGSYHHGSKDPNALELVIILLSTFKSKLDK